MSSWKQKFLENVRLGKRFISRKRYQLALHLGLNIHAPLTIATYRGYASSQRVFLKGRVLKDRFIRHEATDSVWRNIRNTFKRVRSREVQNARIKVVVGNTAFTLHSDLEGYFKLDQPLSLPAAPEDQWITATCFLEFAKNRVQHAEFQAEVLFPNQASLGIISDIDDTVLQTDVTSLFKWKAGYLTLMKNATTRRAFSEVSAFYQALESGGAPGHKNPFFYVSNSPWNLYDMLVDFLEINELPKGPVLLRDFGIPYEDRPSNYKGHKHTSIDRILQTYPDLPFILIGDSGEKDADIYLDITREFPGRIKAIFIRDVRSAKRARRIKRLIRQSEDTSIFLIKNYGEAARLAEQEGFTRV